MTEAMLSDHALIARLAGDTPGLAEAVLDRFGTAARALAADPADLALIPGMSDGAVASFATLQAAVATLLRCDLADRVLLSSWSKLLDYLRATMAHAPVEVLRVMYLDRKNQLIADETPWRGTVDHVPLYPREIVRRALMLRASALILAHNHPSGDPSPSQADIAMTRDVAEAAKLFGIVLHDHVIVAESGHTSFRSAGLL